MSTGSKVHRLIEAEMPKSEGARFIVVADENVLQRALPVLQTHIASIYKPTDLNVYELRNGKFAIGSADPNFYMGIGENTILYSQNPPIPNAVADVSGRGRLTTVDVARFAVPDLPGLKQIWDILRARFG